GEAAGVQAWRDAVHAGRLSADQVAEAFLATDEFLAKALAAGGGTASEKYTRALYQSVLGRAATPAGLADWVRYLDAGGSRVQAGQAFWRSPEPRGRQVDRLYRDYLKRAADAPGRAGWVAALVGGLTETEAARAFLASPEYRAAFDRPTAYLRG